MQVHHLKLTTPFQSHEDVVRLHSRIVLPRVFLERIDRVGITPKDNQILEVRDSLGVCLIGCDSTTMLVVKWKC